MILYTSSLWSGIPCQSYIWQIPIHALYLLPQLSCCPEKSPLTSLSQFSEASSLPFLCFFSTENYLLSRLPHCQNRLGYGMATAKLFNIYLLLTLYDQLQLAERPCSW